jgi:hypothetical protein
LEHEGMLDIKLFAIWRTRHYHSTGNWTRFHIAGVIPELRETQVNSIRIAYNTSYNVVFSTEDPYRIMMFFP